MSAVLIGAPVLAATPDGFITTKAKLSLITTSGVRATAVHVDTNDGIVTLYGKVASDEQRSLAQSAVNRIDGVRQVKNLLQVVAEADSKVVERADKQIYNHVRQALKKEPALRDSRIDVKSVDKGVVLLHGKAATMSDHLRAVAVADQVAGVRRVSSEVEAPERFGEAERALMDDARKAKSELAAKGRQGRNSLDDLRISSAVKLRLWTTADVPSTEINVDTDNNVVTLFGLVPTERSKTLAANEAAKVDGVIKVENLLAVVPSDKKELVDAQDKDIQKNLEAAFKDHPEFADVGTEVKNGTVRLTGTVYSGWDKLNAVRIARFAPGVRALEQQLVVKPAPAEPKPQF